MAYRSHQDEIARRRALAKERLAKGICAGCGKHPVRLRRRDGQPAQQCEACYSFHLRPGRWAHLRSKQVRESKIALGLCSRAGCESEAIPGLVLCDFHRELAQDGLAATRRARREAGLCPVCGDPPVEGKSKCRPCLENYARYQKSYKQKRRGAVPLEVAKPMKKTG